VNSCARQIVAIVMPHRFGIGDAPTGGSPSAYDAVQIALSTTKHAAHRIDSDDSTNTGHSRR
jgi:hypothetical protein